MKSKSIEEFYEEISGGSSTESNSLLPNGIQKEIGHFNVFSIKELYERLKEKSFMPYDRRAYYKISLIRGKNRVEYADKVIEVDQYARPGQLMRSCGSAGPLSPAVAPSTSV